MSAPAAPIRWTPRRKLAALADIAAGRLHPDDLALSPEELATWKRRERDYGLRGLKAKFLENRT